MLPNFIQFNITDYALVYAEHSPNFLLGIIPIPNEFFNVQNIIVGKFGFVMFLASFISLRMCFASIFSSSLLVPVQRISKRAYASNPLPTFSQFFNMELDWSIFINFLEKPFLNRLFPLNVFVDFPNRSDYCVFQRLIHSLIMFRLLESRSAITGVTCFIMPSNQRSSS